MKTDSVKDIPFQMVQDALFMRKMKELKMDNSPTDLSPARSNRIMQRHERSQEKKKIDAARTGSLFNKTSVVADKK